MTGALQAHAASFEVKGVDLGQRVIEGYAAIFGNVDMGGDLIEPGAFDDTLKGRPLSDVKVFVGHHGEDVPVGIPLEITPDRKGLYTRTKILSTSAGDDLLAAAKELQAAGASLGMSIGYRTEDYSLEQTPSGPIRRLKQLYLGEYSYVGLPMNPAAGVTAVKGRKDQTSMRTKNDRLPEQLERAGWESKSGWAYAPDSRTGQLVKTWRVDDITGPLSGNETIALYQKRLRTTLEPAYARAFREWVRLSALHKDSNIAFAILPASEQKALSEGIDTGGGMAVPVDYQSVLIARRAQASVFRRFATTTETNRDAISRPRVLPDSGDTDSIYTSTWDVDWVGEVPTQSGADASFGSVNVPLQRIRARTLISNDLASDAPELLSWLSDIGGADLAVAEDVAFASGNGQTTPLGIVAAQSGLSTVDVEGSTSNTISNTTSSAGSAPKMEDLVYALPSQYHASARWLMRADTEKAIRKLVDAQGHRHFPIERTFQGERSLMAYPVSVNAGMPAQGTDGARVVAFGDLKGYLVVSKPLVSVQFFKEPYGDRDQLLGVLLDRVGGCLADPSSVVLGVV